MQPGEEWISPEIAYTADGGVKLGAGIAPRGSFQIVERDYERAIHRDCTGRWP